MITLKHTYNFKTHICIWYASIISPVFLHTVEQILIIRTNWTEMLFGLLKSLDCQTLLLMNEIENRYQIKHLHTRTQK